MLNAMYTQFDQLSEKHEVYKVCAGKVGIITVSSEILKGKIMYFPKISHSLIVDVVTPTLKEG